MDVLFFLTQDDFCDFLVLADFLDDFLSDLAVLEEPHDITLLAQTQHILLLAWSLHIDAPHPDDIAFLQIPVVVLFDFLLQAEVVCDA